jgi:hypothetical protein
MVAGTKNGGSVHTGVGSTSRTHAGGGGPSSDTVSCISLCKKTITVSSLDNISGPSATVAHNNDGPDPSIAIVQPY